LSVVQIVKIGEGEQEFNVTNHFNQFGKIMNIKERLETLELLNANPTFVNKQLYRMLYSEELFIIAYDHLRKNKGAMTLQ